MTDELRKWKSNIQTYLSPEAVLQLRCELNAIADRIDAEHQKALDEWKAKHGQTWLKGYAECHAELLEGNETLASDLESCGWVRLPVKGEAPSEQLAEWIEGRGLVNGPLDADGEPWHSGDMSDTNWGVIEGIGFSEGEWWVRGHDISAPWIKANSARHYHEPTVEELLEEMYDALDDARIPNGSEKRTYEEIIAEYAQKLQLREA